MPQWEAPAGPELSSGNPRNAQSGVLLPLMAPSISTEIRWWILLAESLFSKLLLCSSLDILSLAVGDPIHQVKGILGGSVLLPANVPQGVTVEKMEWDFYPESGDLGFWLGEFSHGELEHPSPIDQFGQRLDMVDETTLRIKDLEMDDGGIYNARIWFTKAQFQEQSFSLTVYEPVPTPQILFQEVSQTSEGCNVTLQCQAPGWKEFSISWKRGNPPRALGNSLFEYQLSDNGRALRVFWQKNSSDSAFTCLLSNFVDQKNASFDLLKICLSDGGVQSRGRHYIFSSIAVLMGVIMMVVAVIWRRRKQISEKKKRDNHSVIQEDLESSSAHQNSARNPQQDGDNQATLPLRSCCLPILGVAKQLRQRQSCLQAVQAGKTHWKRLQPQLPVRSSGTERKFQQVPHHPGNPVPLSVLTLV